MSDSLRPHESQHARPPCPSPTPGVHPDSHTSSQWCHPAISSSVVPFSSCPQSLPASESFQWVNSSHEVAKVLESQLQHQSFQWTPRTDLLQDGLVGSPCSPRDSQESSPTRHGYIWLCRFGESSSVSDGFGFLYMVKVCLLWMSRQVWKERKQWFHTWKDCRLKTTFGRNQRDSWQAVLGLPANVKGPSAGAAMQCISIRLPCCEVFDTSTQQPRWRPDKDRCWIHPGLGPCQLGRMKRWGMASEDYWQQWVKRTDYDI